MSSATVLPFLALASVLTSCASVPPATVVGTPLVRGTITCDERVTLPPEAELAVQLIDTSRSDAAADGAAPIIAESRYRSVGAPPYSFEIAYEPDRIDPRARYAVQARVDSAGELLLITTREYPVLTHGAGDVVEMRLERIASLSAPDSTE